MPDPESKGQEVPQASAGKCCPFPRHGWDLRYHGSTGQQDQPQLEPASFTIYLVTGEPFYFDVEHLVVWIPGRVLASAPVRYARGHSH